MITNEMITHNYDTYVHKYGGLHMPTVSREGRCSTTRMTEIVTEINIFSISWLIVIGFELVVTGSRLGIDWESMGWVIE